MRLFTKNTIKGIIALLVLLLATGVLHLRQIIDIPPIFSFASASAEELLHTLRVPDGYRITFFVPPSGIAKPRQIAIGSDDWIFVGSSAGKVYAVKNRNGKAYDIRIIAQKLNTPHGVAFYQGDLYIGTVPAVYKINNIINVLNAKSEIPPPTLLIGKLPNNNWHGTRHIQIGPDRRLYLSLGAPCNVCTSQQTEMTGVIRRYQLDGSNSEVYARGIRNSVGFDWHPISGVLWFTDNGRDWLGDDLPHDELNRAPQIGMHFGFPYCHQGDLLDSEYGKQRSCHEFSPPALLTGAHVANLGMAFDTTGQYVYIALHGSWNRSQKSGYAVRRARISNGQAETLEPFVEGWLQQGNVVSGRPVDVAFTAAGDLLISDDYANAIYRVSKTD